MSAGPPDGITGEIALVVGLGNPGPGYAGTRHNLGVMVVNLLATRMGSQFKVHKSGADVVDGRLVGRRVVLARPRSCVNVSGGPVAST
ncbi:MAG: aminoacyl-tRNA hydrolase, partial [Actinomycetota bacterium]|nr:aminoacyl-tRNA hydrolase [Actinomycetota bacterium]